jgi:hypothetical protein
VDLSGTSANSIHYVDEQNYDALILPAIEQAQ